MTRDEAAQIKNPQIRAQILAAFDSLPTPPSTPPPSAVAFEEADRVAANEMCDAAEAPKLERELQILCEIELRKRGLWFLHLSPRAREKEGAPDLIICGPQGQFVAAELKTKTGRLRPAQSETLTQLQNQSASVAVIRSLPDFRAFLTNIKGTA